MAAAARGGVAGGERRMVATYVGRRCSAEARHGLDGPGRLLAAARVSAGEISPGLPTARLLAGIRDHGRRRPRDDDRHAAGFADDVSHHGGGRRRAFAVRIWRARDSRHQAADDARRRSRASCARRSRVVRRRRHQLREASRRRRRDDAEPRSGDAAVRQRDDADGATARRASPLPVRFDALARGTGTPRVRMTVTLGGETDAFEMPLPVSAPLRPETTPPMATRRRPRPRRWRFPPACCPAPAA